MELFLPLPGLWSKNYFYKKKFHFHQELQNWFSKQEKELSEQEIELFLSLPGLWSKNFCYSIFSIFTKEFKIDFQTGNGIISPTFRPPIKILLNTSHLIKGIQNNFQNRNWIYLDLQWPILTYIYPSSPGWTYGQLAFSYLPLDPCSSLLVSREYRQSQ